MGAKQFYEKMYGDSGAKSKTLPLYLKLKKIPLYRRFQIDRYELTYRVAPGGDSVLDIGCGDGLLLEWLRQKYREVWGVDIAETRIDRIRKKFGNESGVHASAEDANERLSFEDASFDTITVVATMEHLFDPYHLMKECYRLLRKEGTLIVVVPNVAWLSNRIGLLMGKLPVTSNATEGWDGGHLHYFTVASLKKLFLDEGFNVVKIASVGAFARLRSLWPSLLGDDVLIMGIKK